MVRVRISRSSSDSTNCSEKLASMHRPVEPASIMKSTQRFWLSRSSSPASVKVVGTTGKTPEYLAFIWLLDDVEVFEELGLHRQAQAGLVVVELQEAVFRHALTIKDVIEQLVADFHVEHREVFAHRRGEGTHGQVVVVHLAGVRDHRHAVG